MRNKYLKSIIVYPSSPYEHQIFALKFRIGKKVRKLPGNMRYNKDSKDLKSNSTAESLKATVLMLYYCS